MLKGAPLSCLVALSIAGQAVTARWISAVTGYGSQAVTTALQTLETMRLAVCDSHRSSWRLLNDQQMLLTFPNREIHDSPLTTTASLNPHIDLNINNSSRSSDPIPENHDPDPLLREILRRAGIGEPKLTYLSNLDLDPVYVYAHCAKAQKQNVSTGILITRLEKGDYIDTKYNDYRLIIELEFPEFFED